MAPSDNGTSIAARRGQPDRARVMAVIAALLIGGALNRAALATGNASSASVASTAALPSTQGPTAAITVPSQEHWHWVGFTNAFCGDGSTTGIGVNFNNRSSRVLIYLEPGGACWTESMCYVEHTAANFTTGYHSGNFLVDSGKSGILTQAGGFFDRSDPSNPFKDDNYIFVPYCTGDLHAGDNIHEYAGGHKAHHVGHANMTAYLQRIVATFPAATQVTLAGSSAGGYGALVNWDQTQQSFGTTEVDLLDDSGTPIPADLYPPTGALYQASFTAWNLAATLPPGCTACTSIGLTALYAYYAATYPGDKGAFLTYEDDSVLPWFFGITATQWLHALAEDFASIDAHPSQHYFEAPGHGHILFFSPALTAGKTSVQTWLARFTTDDPAWSDVTP
jgi:hypothetical protein